jgi:murein DD-endopeptidase MepM/ murein hydrolase activator NlpD
MTSREIARDEAARDAGGVTVAFLGSGAIVSAPRLPAIFAVLVIVAAVVLAGFPAGLSDAGAGSLPTDPFDAEELIVPPEGVPATVPGPVDDAVGSLTSALGPVTGPLGGDEPEENNGDDGPSSPPEEPVSEEAGGTSPSDATTGSGGERDASEPVDLPAGDSGEDRTAEIKERRRPTEPSRAIRSIERTREMWAEVVAAPDRPDPVLPPSLRPFAGLIDVPPGPRSTRDVIDMLVRARATPAEIADVLAPFPVMGAARYANDWGVPRWGPGPRVHEGTDIFAARTTPVIAPADGVATHLRTGTPIGGVSLRLTMPDGSFFYFAHLDAMHRRIREGAEVRRGSVLGFVGDTGNARGTPPHLHFEIHPHGGDPVPPVPYLDAWLARARERALAFVEAHSAGPEASDLAASRSAAPVALPSFYVDAASSAGTRSRAVAEWLIVVIAGAAVLLRRRVLPSARTLVARVSGAGLTLGRDRAPKRDVVDVLGTILARHPPDPGVGPSLDIDLDAELQVLLDEHVQEGAVSRR